MRRLLACLLLLLTLLAAWPVAAQAPERQRRFVYGFYTYQGTEYATGFVPPAVDTIYVLADRQGILDPKMTDVYFWPITNEYRADFVAVNEKVSGTLEISQGSRSVASLELTDYIVQVDQAKQFEGQRLSVGPAAQAARSEFERQRVAFVQAVNEHARAQEDFQRRLQARESPPPVEPVPPAPFTLYSTDLGRGFAVTLPVGEYRIRMRDTAGALVPDSERRLVAITPRRQGHGYEVVPQERWTLPEELHDPSNTIYTAPSGIVYLRPYTTMEFNALEHARLVRPQDLSATPNRWIWVPVAPLEQVTLVVESGGRQERQALASFVVEQVSGPSLGYSIRPAPAAGPRPDPNQPAPDLRDYYRLEAPSGQGTVRFHLIDAGGRALEGSSRELIVTASQPDWVLILLALVPLMAGLGLAIWRRRQILTARSLRPDQRQRMA